MSDLSHAIRRAPSSTSALPDLGTIPVENFGLPVLRVSGATDDHVAVQTPIGSGSTSFVVVGLGESTHQLSDFLISPTLKYPSLRQGTSSTKDVLESRPGKLPFPLVKRSSSRAAASLNVEEDRRGWTELWNFIATSWADVIDAGSGFDFRAKPVKKQDDHRAVLEARTLASLWAGSSEDTNELVEAKTKTFMLTYGEMAWSYFPALFPLYEDDPDRLQPLMSYLAEYASEDTSSEAKQFFTSILNSGRPAWRYLAGSALSRIRHSWASQMVRDRLAIEHNKAVKSILRAAY